MPSVVPGYEYDIFISYRHNDNRSGWVTEFVKALEEELAATIKEPLSIYFDKNPHDGLLETHNVDKSLEGRLKCLVFISIISQTYCDPKSFAWQHEFCVFNKLAGEDQFGRDIKLRNGNVASRILPVKIHDLDPEDKATIEGEIGGVMRAIEFIYKSGGVNRPMNLKDDDVRSQGQILYRDQVNKTANAVKEIISAIKTPNIPDSIDRPQQPATYSSKSRTKYVLGGTAFIVLFIISYFSFPKITTWVSSDEVDRSVAVLAFADHSENKDQEWFSDGLTEEILNKLAKLKELKVAARTSSFYFKDKNLPVSEIASRLGVGHVVEGSVRRVGDQMRITVQLSRAKDGFNLWSETFDKASNDLINVQIEIAESIAKKLINEISPGSLEKLVDDRPDNAEAYEYYLKGTHYHISQYWVNGKEEDFVTSQKMLLKSIELAPDYSLAYANLADLYDTRGSYVYEHKKHWWTKRDSTLQIAYQLNPNSSDVTHIKGYTFLKSANANPNYDSAFYYLVKAYKTNPSNPLYAHSMATFYAFLGLLEQEYVFNAKALQLDPLNGGLYRAVVRVLSEQNRFEEADSLIRKGLELGGNPSLYFHGALGRYYRNDLAGFEKQLTLLEKNFPDSEFIVRLKGVMLAMKGEKKAALEAIPENSPQRILVYRAFDMKKEAIQYLNELPQRFSPDYPVLNTMKYDFLHEDPRFRDFLARQKIIYDDRLKKYSIALE